MGKLSIVVPASNEEQRIGKLVDALLDWIRLERVEAEIIFVLNGTTDRTQDVLEGRMGPVSIIRIIRLPFAGKGLALREGLSVTSNDCIVFMDADFSFHPNQIPKLLRALEKCDLVIGSRRHAETVCEGRPPRYREMLGCSYNRLARLLFRIRCFDTQSGLKAMKPVLKNVAESVATDGFAFDTDLVVRAEKAGLRICEVPIQYRHMKGSRIRMKDILAMLSDTARIWLETRKTEERINGDEIAVRKFYDRLDGDTYFKASRSLFLPRRWWRNSKDGLIIKALETNTHSSRVLDAGCGSGVLASRISGSVNSICGLELGIQAVAFANQRSRLIKLRNADFVRGDCRALPFRDGAFTHVVCSEVLEHLRGPGKSVREFSRVLSSNGIAVITTPRTSVRWALLELIWTRLKRAIQEVHHRSMSELSLKTLLVTNGFGHVSTRPILLGCLTLARATR